MKAHALSAPYRVPAGVVRQVALALIAALALAAGTFMLLEIHAMRIGLESTNAALGQTNEQLRRTTRDTAAMSLELATTNRLLRGMRGQLDTTNGRLASQDAPSATAPLTARIIV